MHHGIVPPEEDYFDYLPITAALWPDLHGLREFITLSAENVSSFEFRDFKVKEQKFEGILITYYTLVFQWYSRPLCKGEYHSSESVFQTNI